MRRMLTTLLVTTTFVCGCAPSKEEIEAHKKNAVWERIGDSWYDDSYRMLVPGGWVVSRTGTGLVFVSDSGHTWKMSESLVTK